MQLATVQMEEQSAKSGDNHLHKSQRKNPELFPVILYLEEDVLPEDGKEHGR